MISADVRRENYLIRRLIYFSIITRRSYTHLDLRNRSTCFETVDMHTRILCAYTRVHSVGRVRYVHIVPSRLNVVTRRPRLS